MDLEIFQKHFLSASKSAIETGRRYLLDALPASVRYHLYPCQSYDGNTALEMLGINPLYDYEEVFPEDALPPGEFLGPLDFEQCCDWLYRDGKLPEWIDVRVAQVDHEYTCLRLLCCGRFTKKDMYLYHQEEGYPPFHATPPACPRDWESLEKDGKFSLNVGMGSQYGN